MNMPLVLLNRRRRGGSFSPYSLFSSTAIGVWLDPSDLTTMFSDRAGTTPVTTPGTVVGLRLDKSKGLVLGSELVVNGTFDSGTTGWTSATGTNVSGTLAASGGLLTLTATGTTAGAAYQGVSTVVGKTYKIEVVVSGTTGTASGSGNVVLVRKMDNTNILSASNDVVFFNGTTTGVTVTGYFTATATTSNIFVQRNSQNNTVIIDNISVRELAGNHAVAPTDAARPIYGVEPKGGRRNLLTYSEDFSNSFWNGGSLRTLQVTTNSTTAPDGTLTANKVVEALAAAGSVPHRVIASDTSASGQKCFSVYAKKAERKRLYMFFNGPDDGGWFDLDTGASGAATDYPGGSVSMTPVGNGWYRCTLTPVGASGPGTYIQLCVISDAATTFDARVGNGTSGIFLWGAQLELGSTATNYQRVSTAYDITESGVATCHYVQYDGSDDSMSTAAIDFTGTDKMSVFAGVRKLSDAATAMIVESSTDSGATNGSFRLLIPAAAGYEYRQRGTINAPGAAVSSGYASPISNIITGLGDISGDLLTLRINGIQVAQSTADQGSSAFGNYPLFFGRRNNASNSFNGKDYGIVIVGKAASAGEITNTETWLAARTAQVTL